MEKQISILIDKFWQGTATIPEKQQLISLLKESGGEWEALLEMRFHRPDFPAEPQLKADRSRHILNLLHQEIADREVEPVTRPKKLFRPLYWSAAAVALLVAGTLFWITQTNKEVPQEQMVAVSPAQGHFIQEINDTETARNFRLPDGSGVKLFAHSTLSYQTSFSKDNRDLDLKGIATFDVAKDPRHPFTVVAMGYATTALGTKFTIHGRMEKPFRVKLFEGKVVVRQHHKSVDRQGAYLEAGEELTVNNHDGSFVVKKFAPPVVVVPERKIIRKPAVDKDQLLRFNKTPLPAVFDRLAATYGIEVVYEQAELATLSFTGVFHQHEPLSLALSSLCALNNLTYQQDGNKIVIRKAIP